MDTYNAFNQSAISNNHLLTADPQIAKTIRSARRGDQIHITGYLVNYKNALGAERHTSTTREDTGQGACEVLYVTGFQILKRGNPVWAPLFLISIYLVIASAVLLVVVFIYETKSGSANSSNSY